MTLPMSHDSPKQKSMSKSFCEWKLPQIQSLDSALTNPITGHASTISWSIYEILVNESKKSSNEQRNFEASEKRNFQFRFQRYFLRMYYSSPMYFWCKTFNLPSNSICCVLTFKWLDRKARNERFWKNYKLENIMLTIFPLIHLVVKFAGNTLKDMTLTTTTNNSIDFHSTLLQPYINEKSREI